MTEEDIQDSSEPKLFESNLDPEKLIHDEVPDFGPLAYQSVMALIPFVRGFMSRADEYPATATIFSQAVSDFMSLMSELRDGMGRSAVRSARSIIEHSVNIHDVESSTTRSSQYMQHLGFEAEFSDAFTLGIDLLPRNQQRKLAKQREHRLKKVRPVLDAALNSYGSWFRRGWAQENLLERAKRYGLDYLYPAYRLSSLVIHGAPGGILGLVRTISGRKVHRTAAVSYDLCPFAYISGIYAMTEVCRAAGSRRPDLDITPFTKSLEYLKKVWPEYVEAMKKIDNRIWPKEPPPHPTAVLALSRNWNTQWYWYDPVTEVLIAADDPVLSSDEKARISRFIAEVHKRPDAFFINGRQWATYYPTSQVVANPKPNSRIIPSREIMLTPEEIAELHVYTIAPDGSTARYVK